MTIGNRAAPDRAPDHVEVPVPRHLQRVARRMLAALVTSGRGGEAAAWTTGDIAARLGITARTPERDALNSALTALRRARLLRYRVYSDSRGRQSLEWHLTEVGVELARALPTGVDGRRRAETAASPD